jgi:hypothetical protein
MPHPFIFCVNGWAAALQLTRLKPRRGSGLPALAKDTTMVPPTGVRASSRLIVLTKKLKLGHLLNTQEWPPILCLTILVLDDKASGTTVVVETVLANDSLSTLRDFANAWRDSAVSSRRRLNSAMFVLS